MPQVIAAIIAIIAFVWILAAAIFVIQWIGALFLVFYQAVLFPFFIYLLPSFIMLFVMTSFFYGSWLAWRSYVKQLNLQIASEGRKSKLINGTVKSILILVLVATYLVSCTGFFYLSGPPFVEFQNSMLHHFEQIKFPGYPIVFPFWD